MSNDEVPFDDPAKVRASMRASRMESAETAFASGDMSGLLRAIVVSAAANEPLPNGHARGCTVSIQVFATVKSRNSMRLSDGLPRR